MLTLHVKLSLPVIKVALFLTFNTSIKSKEFLAYLLQQQKVTMRQIVKY